MMGIWDKPQVELLLDAAAKIEKTLPAVIRGGHFNSWASIENSGQGIYRDKHTRYSPTPAQTAGMELYDAIMQLLTWLNSIDPGKHYTQIIWGRAIGTHTYTTAKKCGIAPATVNRHWHKGITLLVDRLNTHGDSIPPAIKNYFADCVR